MSYHQHLSEALRTDERLGTRPDWIVAYVEQNLRLLDRVMSGGDVAQIAADIEALGRICAHRT